MVFRKEESGNKKQDVMERVIENKRKTNYRKR